MRNKEVWLPVQGANNLYKISSLGKVTSINNDVEITNTKGQIHLIIDGERTAHTKIELMAKHFEVKDFSIKTLMRKTPDIFYTIVDKVMRYYNLDEKTLFSETRNRYVVTARQMIFKLCKQSTNYSLAKIGKHLNTKDHQIPGYSVRNMNQLLDVNKEIREDYGRLLYSINTNSNNTLCRAIEELIPL